MGKDMKDSYQQSCWAFAVREYECCKTFLQNFGHLQGRHIAYRKERMASLEEQYPQLKGKP